MHQRLARVGSRAERQLLERGEERVVDEIEQRVAGDALIIGGPRAPAQGRGQRRDVGGVEFQLALAVIENLEEDQPHQLRDALRVAIHARILPHDVLNRFDGGGNRQGASRIFFNAKAQSRKVKE